MQEINISPFVKHSVVSTVPQSPNQSTRPYSDLCLNYFIYTIEPISKHIRNISRWYNVKSRKDNSPSQTGKRALEEQMIARLIGITKRTFWTSIPIMFC
jgi:hypothetical protein